MLRSSKPFFSIGSVAFLIGIISIAQCRFSFADTKRPAKESITFGAQKKPDIKTTPAIESFRSAIADVAEKVLPCVVSIVATKIDTVVIQQNPFFFSDPFEFFFGNPYQRREPQLQKREFRQQGMGSGVIASSNGYVLTNYHVVQGANEIKIQTYDQKTFDAKIIGSDSLSDVAVLKITDEVSNLPVAYFGDSDKLRVGDWVVAIGSPFGFTSTVTMGIVSALGRKVGDMGPRSNKYEDFIQTDAAINRGNSGGALVNIDGELVGINTMIITPSGAYAGIGLAIPINMARRVMEDLIFEGKVRRGWLGVSISDIDDAAREALGLGEQRGVLIGDVFKGQPADKGGIQRGDVVIEINGKKIENANQLRNTVAAIRPGTTVPFKIIRKGKEITLNIKLSERDEDKVNKIGSNKETEEDESEAKESDSVEKIGIKVGSLTPQLKERLGVDKATQGVVVLSVEDGSEAAEKGLRPDDIIREVNQEPVPTPKDFQRVVKKLKKGQSVLLLVERRSGTFFIAFKLKK